MNNIFVNYNRSQKNEKVNNYKLKILFMIITVLLFFSFSGLSFAVFRYGFDFNNKNSDNTADMVYSYVESNKAGNGILIDNAYPITDQDGKILTGENYTFNFTVTFYPRSLGGVYQLIAIKNDNSSLPENFVKLYLTTKTSYGGVEKEIRNSINKDGKVKRYNEYQDFNTDGIKGKILYSETVTEKMINEHNKYFTFRMWIDENAVFDNNTSNKKFKVKINFYGNTNKKGQYEK